MQEAKLRLLAALRAPSPNVEAIKAALRPEADGGAALGEQEKAVLELAFRLYMEEILAKSQEPGQSIEAAGVPQHLDLAIALAAADSCDYNTPFALLEDLFDANVISEAESLFALVEARAAALAPLARHIAIPPAAPTAPDAAPARAVPHQRQRPTAVAH